MPIILEDSKFLWTDNEINECTQLYNAGFNVYQIAKQMKENPDDVALLIIHLGQKGELDF